MKFLFKKTVFIFSCLTVFTFEHTLCSSATDGLNSDQLTKQKAGEQDKLLMDDLHNQTL